MTENVIARTTEDRNRERSKIARIDLRGVRTLEVEDRDCHRRKRIGYVHMYKRVPVHVHVRYALYVQHSFVTIVCMAVEYMYMYVC